MVRKDALFLWYNLRGYREVQDDNESEYDAIYAEKTEVMFLDIGQKALNDDECDRERYDGAEQNQDPLRSGENKPVFHNL